MGVFFGGGRKRYSEVMDHTYTQPPTARGATPHQEGRPPRGGGSLKFFGANRGIPERQHFFSSGDMFPYVLYFLSALPISIFHVPLCEQYKQCKMCKPLKAV